MAPSKGFTARNTILSIGSGGTSETFTPIAQLKNFSFSGQTWATDKITNTQSPAVGVGVLDEEIPTVMSPGTMAIDGVFLPSDAGQTALATAFNAGTLTDFKLQLPLAPGQTTSGNLYTFSAYVIDFPLPQLSFDKSVTFKANLKLNTVITVTIGS